MDKHVQKNKEYFVEIIDQGSEGEGIAKIYGFTIFIPKVIIGEICKIKIVKVLSSHAFGKVIKIYKLSPKRIQSDCASYPRCGGCQLRHMSYEATLDLKTKKVQNLVNKMLHTKVNVKNTIGMKSPYNYRNKTQFPVGINKYGDPEVGVFAQRSHEIIPMQECNINKPIAKKIADIILQFVKENNISIYDEKTNKGILRHIVIRIGEYTEEIMCILVINHKEFPEETKLISKLKQEIPKLKTVIINENKKNTNVILGEHNRILYGDGFIEDKLGRFTFKISPSSFYQINSIQTEILYKLAIEMAEIQKKDIVFDLYCGIGTIGIFASTYAKKVYGVEIVNQAIRDAKENANRNGVQNTNWIAGDVEQVFELLINKQHIKPDIVIVDPPRKGLDKITVENLMNVKPKKIVYISCNPATLVRDLKYLEEKYEIIQIQPVDMFPLTSHVECCSVLCLKDTTK